MICVKMNGKFEFQNKHRLYSNTSLELLPGLQEVHPKLINLSLEILGSVGAKPPIWLLYTLWASLLNTSETLTEPT